MVEYIFLKNYFLSFTTKFKATFIRLISLNNSSKFNNKINKIKSPKRKSSKQLKTYN